MRSSDFFTEEDDPFSHINGDPWGTTTVFNDELVAAIRKGEQEGTSDVSAALALLDLADDELRAFGTSGGEQLSDQQIGHVLRALEAVTKRLGRPLELPFRNFTTFRTHWIKRGAAGSGGYQARREIIEELLEPVRRELTRLEDDAGGPQLREAVIADLRDPTAIEEHLARIQRAVMFDDPTQVIGSAKELVESTAKTVLLERGWPVNDKDDVPALVSQSQRAIGLHPSTAMPGPDGSNAVKTILGGMMTITSGLAELRNKYGTGHGQAGGRGPIKARHAHLAVNTAVTWCQLMLDTLQDKEAPWTKNPPTP